jgi:GH15 family glucan-1,4-alpha-glucosidase
MSERIEDYAVVGDTHTVALISRRGSVDWLCLPRFDSGACFAALLGSREHGHWKLGPAGGLRSVRRAYRGGTLVLDTEFETEAGAVTLTDCMSVAPERTDLVRVVTGRRGRVPIEMELVIRFDYGSAIPWVRRLDGGLTAFAGPDALILRTPVGLSSADFRTCAEFSVGVGESIPFVLSWYPSHLSAPSRLDPLQAIADAERYWREWGSRFSGAGEWEEDVRRSLLTLKALTYGPTGGVVAAPTTSLPEQLGGGRNWDYRYCWLRDATFTLYALLISGYHEEACAWREWLLRAAAGHPQDVQIMYGVAGERRLLEFSLDWLPGYENSSPVRIGNSAFRQFQLDVYGEVMDVLHVARRAGLQPGTSTWDFQRVLLEFLESKWNLPDEGIWEVRGPQRHFTYSKVMAWVAFDRAVKAVQRFKLDGPVERWQGLRDRIHAEVCRAGFDAERGIFVQSFGSRALDASLLLMPLVGFLPATDPRVEATVEAVRRELTISGLVRRYTPDPELEGVGGSEGVFLPCSFWLADNLALQGRTGEAQQLFEFLLSLRNDVGLLAEEYDPASGRQMGNFPQALSHVALVNTAFNLTHAHGPMRHRSENPRPEWTRTAFATSSG